MKRSPWLAVAVYDLAPVADAPIATGHRRELGLHVDEFHTGVSVPAFTMAPTASMMWVWGEIGYAHRPRSTKGHGLRDALEPSIVEA